VELTLQSARAGNGIQGIGIQHQTPRALQYGVQMVCYEGATAATRYDSHGFILQILQRTGHEFGLQDVEARTVWVQRRKVYTACTTMQGGSGSKYSPAQHAWRPTHNGDISIRAFVGVVGTQSCKGLRIDLRTSRSGFSGLRNTQGVEPNFTTGIAAIRGEEAGL
jgi:hypothetical protein